MVAAAAEEDVIALEGDGGVDAGGLWCSFRSESEQKFELVR